MPIAQNACKGSGERVVPASIVIRSSGRVPGRCPCRGTGKRAMENHSHRNAIRSGSADRDGTPGGEGSAAREGSRNEWSGRKAERVAAESGGCRRSWHYPRHRRSVQTYGISTGGDLTAHVLPGYGIRPNGSWQEEQQERQSGRETSEPHESSPRKDRQGVSGYSQCAVIREREPYIVSRSS